MSASTRQIDTLSPAARQHLLKSLRGRQGIERSGPLSDAQRRLWFLDRLLPGSSAYNEATATRVRIPLCCETLRRAIDAITARHEALRTTFHLVNGVPVQRVHAPAPAELPVADLTHLPGERALDEARRLVGIQIGRGFDLQRGPLLRTQLIRLGPSDHILVLSMHHIVCDGWSMRLFVEEMALLYEAFARGAPSPLPPLPLQYLDYAEAEGRFDPALRGSGRGREDGLGYWVDRLSAMEELDLPADRPLPEQPSFRGGRVPIEIPASAAAALRTLCEKEKATLFMAGLAGFMAMLHRVTLQDDIVVGCPVVGRGRVELEKLIGFFVNTVVIRSDWSGDPTFREALARTRETALAAYAHQHVPFERIVQAVAPARDARRNPIFQVAFQLQESAAAGDLPIEPFEVADPPAKFSLRCDLWPDPSGRLLGHLDYSADLFEPATARTMARQLETLLAAMARSPDRRVSEAQLLTGAEEQSELRAGCGPVVARSDGRRIHRRVADLARLRPDSPAVAEPGRSLSYGELDARADRIAAALAELGAGPGRIVAIASDSAVSRTVAALAVMKSAAAYLPLDPAYPAERIRSIVGDSRPLCILGDAAADFEGVPALDIGRLAEAAVDRPFAPGRSGADEAAYLIYTSGSTGRPQGVEISHSALENLVDWHVAAYAVGPADRASLVASPGFDASVWETWPYLAAGASLHAPPPVCRLDPDALAEWMSGEGITLSFLPTPLAEMFVDRTPPSGLKLRALLTGGDRLRRYPERRLPYRLINHYGPSEAAVVATFFEVESGAGLEGLPPIGRPIDNVRCYVLDRHSRPVPPGARGELHVAGAGVGRGYFGNGALTRTRFRPDRLAADGARMFGTGDIVHRRHDGELVFLGRSDSQLKVRGQRIEPAEIEMSLAAHPCVSRALVVQRPDGALEALLVPRNGTTAAPAELRRFLATRCTAGMIPSAFTWCDALPLTEHDKLDRKAASRLASSSAGAAEDVEPPADDTESVVANLWSRLLGDRSVGRHDNFFDVGGHSLLLVQVHGELVEAFGTKLSLIDLFSHPTVAQLAAAIAEERNSDSSRQSVQLEGSEP